jgi:hypothetical protein
MNPTQARVREIQDMLNKGRNVLAKAEREGIRHPLTIPDIRALIDIAHEAITLQQTETYTWPG